MKNVTKKYPAMIRLNDFKFMAVVCSLLMSLGVARSAVSAPGYANAFGVERADLIESQAPFAVKYEAAPVLIAQFTLDRMMRSVPSGKSTAEKETGASSTGSASVLSNGSSTSNASKPEVKALTLHFKKDQRADLVLRDFLKANKMTLDWRYPFYLILDEDATFQGDSARDVIMKALSALGLRATLDSGRTLIVDQRF